jgi:hypothetical protein
MHALDSFIATIPVLIYMSFMGPAAFAILAVYRFYNRTEPTEKLAELPQPDESEPPRTSQSQG